MFTTVQDLGRHGCLRFGVPVSGGMDQFSLIAANYLVGNQQNSACLETTLIGPELQTLTKTQIAITGGGCSPKINDTLAPMWQTLTVKDEDIISFGRMETGCRAYIAVRGGIKVPLVLGSASTYLRGQLGGIQGRQLRNEDLIEGFDVEPSSDRYFLSSDARPQYSNEVEVGVVMGPQEDMFTDNGIETLLSNKFRVTLEADRMGYRLEGPSIEHKKESEIVSDAILPGAIQVPKSGKPILMMRDAQTTGGYPKIAAVITPDLSKLGQSKPNDSIKFSRIALHEAQVKLKENCERIRKLETCLLGI